MGISAKDPLIKCCFRMFQVDDLDQETITYHSGQLRIVHELFGMNDHDHGFTIENSSLLFIVSTN